ncbi:MAG: hypothetical protein H7318_19555 [Oligoflexus sp.]|nr:hypothetical protein [Oligoflexus sp.]
MIKGSAPRFPVAMSFPAILKPIRGRGSAGVTLIKTEDEFQDLTSKWVETDEFGSSFMLEELLPGEEITVAVMPPGTYLIKGVEEVKSKCWALPAVKRMNHVDLVAPYNGVVAVVNNSFVLNAEELKDPDVIRITKACEKAGDLVGSKAVIRVDCRHNTKGLYEIFDLNMKPNLTGAGRPGRSDQDSLVALAARAIGGSIRICFRTY